LARQQRIEKQKKRKVGEVDVTETTLSSTNGNAASGPSTTPAATATPASAPKKTAVWVTNLPPNTTPSKLASVFSKAGVLLIGDDGEPRIKLYYDDDGNFKGEALVMYFKEGSVTLAETLLDDTELELGSGHGNMRVKVAEYERSTQKTNEDKKAKKDEGEKVEKKKLTAEEKQRMTKRIKRMQEWVLLPKV
jgi:HIV Tat-specific factor 1